MIKVVRFKSTIAAAVLSFALLGSIGAQQKDIEIVQKEKQVDILIDGKHFTSYIWPDDLKKPALFPVRTARGTVVTRGYPLEPRGGESIDHPHQVGLWFNYGDVNGVDFWNNSTYRSKEDSLKMGTIVHRRVVQATSGKTRGELIVDADWILSNGKPVLKERTRFIFSGDAETRTIDRITTLTALNEKVLFNDNKEGLIGFRVSRELEQPSKAPILITDAHGKVMKDPVLDNSVTSGLFRSSEGKTGDEVWGTRGKWAMLSGKVGEEPVTLAILDNPENIGFPTYWFTRGYGLFAANPLGQKAFSTEKKETPIRELKFALEPKQSVTFRFRVLILSKKAGHEEIEAEYRRFSGGRE